MPSNEVPMIESAAAWLDALSPEQRAKATFDFDNEQERTSWAYFPRNHAGLPLREMDVRQQKLAHRLISSALSVHAYAKVTAIMALESVLNLLEDRRGDAVRDPGRYFITVFGAVGDGPWGWRLEGHHVVLNFTLVDGGIIAPTPLFLGANPAAVRHGDHPVTRPCGEEEDVARDLLASLDAEQRRSAIICDVAPPDFVLMNLPAVPESLLPGEAGALPPIQRDFDAMKAPDKQALRFDRARPAGLAVAQMDASQRRLLDGLVDVYISRVPDDLASSERSRIGPGGLDPMHFAWAGSDRRGEGHYYRLQSPLFLVEYDNTQDGANHVHAVWRDPDRDFGREPLRAHVRSQH